MSSNNNQNSKKNEITSIRFGIIIQNSSLVKIDELFELYFQKSNPIVIKKEKIEYEFSPNENKDLRLIFNILTDDVMKNIQQIYSSFNFYIIFMDIQNSSALKNLEKDINKLISCSDDILTKFYIFGVFQEEDLIVIKDEKISTILNCKGGDASFLKQEFKIAGNDQKRTLLDTLKAIIIYSGRISIGKHQMPLLDTADWNDCLRLDKQVLSGPEKEEAYYEQLKTKKQEFGVPLENTQSESVMNACLLKIAADELCEMAILIDDDETDALCKQIAADIYTSMQENAWINGYFARCLINDGRPYSYLGSKGDRLSLDPDIDGTYYLNSYSWPLLADIASEQQISDMLEVIDSYLKTPAGLKLVSPVDYDKLGIVTGSSFYFPGDRENGGVFKHAAMMATVASLQKAKTVKDQQLAQRLKDLAFFMIDKTLPYKTLEDPYILKGNPRFCTQYNNSETGEGIGPILSGTASWLTLAIYEILGIEYKGDKISFEPIINTPKLHYTLKLKDTKLEVTIRQLNDYKVNRNSRFFLDGKECEQCITVPEDQKVHRLEIEL